MICKICGAPLSNDDNVHETKYKGKKVKFCDGCSVKRKRLAIRKTYCIKNNVKQSTLDQLKKDAEALKYEL